jgi:phosphoglycolate phosphatase-like HAD superfamily hydrolase
MEPHAEPEALSLARLENRHLQETIKALRDALEHMQIDKEDSIQNAVASANHEIAQLKATITAQREAMERLQAAYEDTLQALERRSRDEVQHLQQTIVALRELLEAQHVQHSATPTPRETAAESCRTERGDAATSA